MANELTKEDIRKRLIHARNIERLYHEQKKQLKKVRAQNLTHKQTILNIQQEVDKKTTLIQTLTLRIEALERIIFGKGAKDKNDDKDDENNNASKIFLQSLKNKAQKGVKRSKESFRRAIPTEHEVTDFQNHPLDDCPLCATKLINKKTVVYYEEDIVLPTKEKPLKQVIKHTIEKGYCSNCLTWYSAGKVPLTKVIIGKRVRLYIWYLSILLRTSFSQIRELLLHQYNFRISEGEIANILHKNADKFRVIYERIKQRIRKQKGVHMDETSWKAFMGSLGAYGWVMLGIETNEVVFSLAQSRGKGNAEKLYGNSSAVLISDAYRAYRNIASFLQLCWAHIHRKLRDLATSSKLDLITLKHCQMVYHEFAVIYTKLRGVLTKPYDKKTYLNNRTRLIKQLTQFTAEHVSDPQQLKAIRSSLARDMKYYFTCLLFPNIPCDNNKAERAIRHMVLKRNISFGSLTDKGAETTSILASVLLSLKARRPDDFFQYFMKTYADKVSL